MIISDVKDFGYSLKERRKELGYTQKDVADYTGFSVSFLSELENGKATAEFGKAIIVANVLGLDLLIKDRG